MPPPPIPVSKPKSSGNLAGRIVLIGVAAFIAFLVFRVFQYIQYRKDQPSDPTPGYVELKEATKKTVGKSSGIANGNTPAARDLAEKLSQNLGVLRRTLFEGRDPNAGLLTSGQFLVYCQMNADSCAFIVHVPELRHYTSEAQQSIAELAYITACQLLDSSEKPGPRRLAIATRGAVLFDTVLLGDYTPQQEKPLASVTKATHERATAKVLYPFFAAAAKDSKPNP